MKNNKNNFPCIN